MEKTQKVKKQISLVQKILSSVNIRRKKNFENMREFQKKVIDMIDEKTAKRIGSISDVCRLNNSYSLEFTAKDYAWWGTINSDNCDIIPLGELQEKLTDKLRKIIDNLRHEDINMELAEEIIEAFKQ